MDIDEAFEAKEELSSAISEELLGMLTVTVFPLSSW